MRIKFFEPTYIRSRPDDLTEASIIGYVFSKSEIEVADELVAGAEIDGNDRWFTDRNGWFYASGRAAVVVLPAPKAEILIEKAVEPADESAPENLEIAPPPPAVFAAEPENPKSEIENPNSSRPPIFSQFVADFPFRNLDDWAADPSIPQGETRPASLAANPNSTALEAFSMADFGARNADFPNPSRAFSAVAASAIPNSEFQIPHSKNWAIDALGLAETFWEKGITGRGVRVALLSTGVDGGCFELEEAVFDAFLAQNLLPASLEDEDGIGTQAAAMAAGRGPSAVGAAPDADLLIAKIGSLDRLISPENLLEGIDWAVAAGAEIVAMLVDFSTVDPVLEKAISEKIESASLLGTLFLAPVGNSSEKVPQKRFPASLAAVLAVGSHDRAGERSIFSAKSHDLDLLAPGEGLVCMGLGNQILPLNAPSTAIATAFAAGVLALLVQAERERPDFFGSSKKPFDRLREAAFSPRNFVEAGEDVEFGWGILRLEVG